MQAWQGEGSAVLRCEGQSARVVGRRLGADVAWRGQTVGVAAPCPRPHLQPAPCPRPATPAAFLRDAPAPHLPCHACILLTLPHLQPALATPRLHPALATPYLHFTHPATPAACPRLHLPSPSHTCTSLTQAWQGKRLVQTWVGEGRVQVRLGKGRVQVSSRHCFVSA